MLRASIDRGGSFCDVYGELVDGEGRLVRSKVLKLLSEDPGNYKDAPREGVRRLMEAFFSPEKFPRDEPLDTSRIESIRMGTTVATNALLERKGERFALLTTRGYKDVWHIGGQSRPDIFDLEISCPETLYQTVEEVDERVVIASKDAKYRFRDFLANSSSRLGTCVTGEQVIIERELDLQEVRKTLSRVYKQGIRAVAVVLMHAALFPDHEKQIGQLAFEMGFSQVSLSHEVMQMVKIVPRGYTTSADAYLTPHIKRYIDTFRKGFDAKLLERVNVSFMQSDGGLTRVERFTGNRAILSGPAGGVLGYALTSQLAERLDNERAGGPEEAQFVGFDMGGTSADFSRYAGHLEHVFETTTAGVTIQAPQLNISTVAAGGGSKLSFFNGLLQVGPESVGAHPGPVCYRKGGELAVTDANVMLGRLLPEHFPRIFGPTEDQPLDAAATAAAFRALGDEVNAFSRGSGQPAKSVEELAYGFIKVANETMSRPIRNLTQMRGFDLSKHTLVCFGGAGGQHACAIARGLGMRKVFIHRYSGILSAYGIGLADVVEDRQEPCAAHISVDGQVSDPASVARAFSRLEEHVRRGLVEQGFGAADIRYEYFLNLRFHGTDTALMTRSDSAGTPIGDYVARFCETYQREFGFLLQGRQIIVDDVRVRGSGQSLARLRQERELGENLDSGRGPARRSTGGSPPTPLAKTRAYFEDGWTDTAVHRLQDVTAQASGTARLEGPAILIDPNSTIIVEPYCTAYVSPAGDVTLELLPMPTTGSSDTTTTTAHGSPVVKKDAIQLSLFSHRFMGIAEQMGRTLQRTSVSVNIKERLDFSCALFGPDGGLVANAPHIPVHLGAMQEAVRFQHRLHLTGGDHALSPGDVLVSNHPQLAGGSHLPDITVITPCFDKRTNALIFWVASRGHHADVGGITPGSMPPHSQSLADEGAAIVSFKLVKNGHFQEAGITEILTQPSNPLDASCTGTRCLSDNLSDLRAQVAANNHGTRLVQALVDEFSLDVVQAYMQYVQENAEGAVRSMLRAFARARLDDKASSSVIVVEGFDRLDDGTPIRVRIQVDADSGNALFDFEGTGPQVAGNCNAPPAVTYSAIIYSLRCLVGQDIPLNQGCLAPVTIKIPAGSVLNPSQESAVVGGNVLTSQRVVDVVLRAFDACAASQGCMNNLTFGDESFGYYETIAGGAGAGPTWDGRSGIHTHMTNTRITDPEILERRYPVLLRVFSLRPHSGGPGMHYGGDGVIREIEFLRRITFSLLTERRAFAPYGLHGGSDGACGVNLFITADNRTINLGGKRSMDAKPGERIRLLTPGGGGYGVVPNDNESELALSPSRL